MMFVIFLLLLKGFSNLSIFAIAHRQGYERNQHQSSIPWPTQRVRLSSDDFLFISLISANSDLRKMAMNLVPFPRVSRE